MERVWSTSHRGFSVRSILMFVLTVFITAFLWIALGNNTAARALDGPTASWKGESILFDGHQYFSAGEVKAGDSIGLPVGTKYYLYTPDTSGSATKKTQKALVIYFAPGVDPPIEKTATHATYDYSPTKVFSNQTDKKTIPVTIRGAEDSYSSCTIQGIGWIICPVTTFLADGMDAIFDIVKGFLVVQPANTTNNQNSLYIAWDIMRGIANVAFIIVFLIIIYSQLTNLGVSNYGLKKLLPRLVIAAVLVNLSYIICAIAVDISNILGYSLQDIFTNIRKDTFNISNDTWNDSAGMGWSAVTAFVLSGGAASIGLIAATGGTIASAIYLLVPILIGLILTILFVLLILAARQAIIVILIVIAPLAFVAYLLPNTEKWFEKWRELFMTMLIFFPAFSLAFGGSQLAGGLIIQNATSIIGVIFGMAVQIAPLIITPLLLKLSGGLLGRIAGMVNDPRKGLLDRTKSWSGDRAAMHKQRGLRDTKLGRFNAGPRRIARAMDNNNRTVKKRTEMYGGEADNRYNRTKRYEKLFEQSYGVETEKKRIEQGHNRDLHNKIRGDATLLGRELTVRVTTDEATEASAKLDATYEGFKSGKDAVLATRHAGLSKRATDVTRSIALTAIRNQSAKREQTSELYAALKTNVDSIDGQFLREYAGGVQGFIGAQRALAQAISEQHKAHSEVIANANAILDDYNLNADENLNIAKNISVKNITITDDILEAAIKRVGANGVMPHIDDLFTTLDLSPAGNENFRLALVNSLKGNGGRPKYVGMGLLDAMTQGIPGGVTSDTVDKWIEDMLLDGKLSANELATQDKDTLTRIAQALPRLKAVGTRTPAEQANFNSSLINLQTEIDDFRKDTDLVNKAGERKTRINDIELNL